jgi:hypothetical protein
VRLLWTSITFIGKYIYWAFYDLLKLAKLNDGTLSDVVGLLSVWNEGNRCWSDHWYRLIMFQLFIAHSMGKTKHVILYDMLSRIDWKRFDFPQINLTNSLVYWKGFSCWRWPKFVVFFVFRKKLDDQNIWKINFVNPDENNRKLWLWFGCR